MDLKAITNSAADEADSFLAGVTSMTEARPVIREYLAERHPGLKEADIETVVAGVLSILDDEGFFEAGSSRDAWTEGDEESGN